MKASPKTVHPVERIKAMVAMDRVVRDDAFRFRAGGVDAAHKADLASTIRNTRKPLDPVVLWQREGKPEGGSLVLLDGAHRLAAYRAVSWDQPIPAIIVSCDHRMALRAALTGNSRRSLQLTQVERMDAAWRLVREPVQPRYKVTEISAAADVSLRTVKYMRKRERVMHEAKIEVTGQWARDRTSAEFSGDTLDNMSDVQRNAEIKRLTAEVRDLIDRRKHPDRTILRDSEAVETAIFDALGDKRVKAMFEFYFGGENPANEWLELSQHKEAFVDEWTDEEPEPNF